MGATKENGCCSCFSVNESHVRDDLSLCVVMPKNGIFNDVTSPAKDKNQGHNDIQKCVMPCFYVEIE